jgi:hypothetical protein
MASTEARGKGDPRRPAKSGKTRQAQWLPRHDIFAEAIVNGRTIKDAFTLATGKGSPGGSTAQKWLAWEPMKARITVLRAERLNRLALDKDQVILNLMDVYSNAMRADQYMAATRAMDQVAKLLDLYPSETSKMEVHLIAKPATEPGKTVELSVEDWKEQFSPREIVQQ